MNSLSVRHATGEYEVLLGAGLLADNTVFAPFARRRALIVTDTNVAREWLPALAALLPQAHTLMLPAGGNAKTLENVARIWAALAEHAVPRDGVLFALGGGVIGDMTGFAAACWMRGIDFVQIPTTLLAQVDASVGGKTGIDLPEGKNLVGAFHQPACVIIDARTLDTLPDREYFAGFAEIIKAALLADAGFLAWLEQHADALHARDDDALLQAIARSCAIKAEIVAADERETGQRALLNLGHTFAHALESITGYTRFLHGEAVAIGLVLAAALSETRGLDAALRPRLVRLLQAFELPAALPADIDLDAMLAAMRLDKKHRTGGWRLVLLDDIARARIETFAEASAVRRVLEEHRVR